MVKLIVKMILASIFLLVVSITIPFLIRGDDLVHSEEAQPEVSAVPKVSETPAPQVSNTPLPEVSASPEPEITEEQSKEMQVDPE